MHVATLLPASIRRAFALMGGRLRALVADAPLLFFGVVLGLALVFRLGVGAAREAAQPEVVAPTFVTGAEPRTSASADAKLRSDPNATALPSTAPSAELGAAARVAPIGSPSPARVAPRPRGHGRRVLGGGRRGGPAARE